MRKSEYAPREAGKLARDADQYSDEEYRTDDTKWEAQFGWLGEDVPKPDDGLEQLKSYFEDQLTLQLKMQLKSRLENVLTVTSPGDVAPSLVDLAFKTMNTLYQGARDAWAMRRRRTAATVATAVGVGTGVGFVIGTLIFPVIGSAVGATFGASVAAALNPVMTVAGMSVLGAFAGSRMGQWISKKLYKGETYFQLPVKITLPVKQKFGLSSRCTTLISSYLYNRRKSAKSKVAKSIYRTLREAGIKKADPIAMDRIVLFFCNELRLLTQQQLESPHDQALKKEVDTVREILGDLKHENSKIRKQTKELANHALLTHHRLIQFRRRDAQTQDMAIAEKFSADLKAKAEPSSQQQAEFRPATLRLASVPRSRKKREKMVAEVVIEPSSWTPENQAKHVTALANELSALKEAHPGAKIEIKARGQDELAVFLYREALTLGFKPTLSDSEYSGSGKSRKTQIIQEAKRLAKEEGPAKKKRRMAFSYKRNS